MYLEWLRPRLSSFPLRLWAIGHGTQSGFNEPFINQHAARTTIKHEPKIVSGYLDRHEDNIHLDLNGKSCFSLWDSQTERAGLACKKQ
jgi:hypothetical protein